MNNIIIDSGFWFALYDPRDANHRNANNISEYLTLGNILMPYPTLYETINSRFAKRVHWMNEFENLVYQRNVNFIDDSDYKDEAINLTFNTNNLPIYAISLVDMTIRLMLDDNRLNIDYLISFDRHDFIDVCHKNFIEIISS